MAAGWFYSPPQIARYLLTRIPSLRPPRVNHATLLASSISLTTAELSCKEPNSGSPAAEPTSMADVPGWLPWLDMGCLRFFHRIADRY